MVLLWDPPGWWFLISEVPLYSVEPHSSCDVCLRSNLISHEVFSKSFRRSQLPHKSVNVSLTITIIKNEVTDFFGQRFFAERL